MIHDVKKYNVGVVIGRFQSPRLHEGHRALLDYAMKNHNKVVIFVGVHPAVGSKENPLDFPTRKLMLEDYVNKNFSHCSVQILHLEDTREDSVWSDNIDKTIKSIYPFETVVLYGGRESFVESYKGKYNALDINVLLNIRENVSSTQLREQVKYQIPLVTQDFREGVIYATQRRYKITNSVVDIALMQKNTLFLGKRASESQFRFFGGFVDYESGDTCNEDAAKRELREEAGQFETGDMIYIGSVIVKDWRYAHKDKLMTTIFYTELLWGKPIPEGGDDMDGGIVSFELDFNNVAQLQSVRNKIVQEHRIIFDKLVDYKKGLL